MGFKEAIITHAIISCILLVSYFGYQYKIRNIKRKGNKK